MISPLIFVIAMRLGWERWSSTVILALFLTYSVVMGMSLSFIFLVYAHSVIYTTFGIAAGMFGGMALLGYTTKTDLTKLGSMLFMALIGLFIIMILNIFIASENLNNMINFLGVIIFTGLTAYHVQNMKNIGEEVEEGTETTMKLSIISALRLYLLFINLFLFLLRMFGRK